jgi:hypothetical protein
LRGAFEVERDQPRQRLTRIHVFFFLLAEKGVDPRVRPAGGALWRELDQIRLEAIVCASFKIEMAFLRYFEIENRRRSLYTISLNSPYSLI